MKKFFKVLFWVCFFPAAIVVYTLWLPEEDKGATQMIFVGIYLKPL